MFDIQPNIMCNASHQVANAARQEGQMGYNPTITNPDDYTSDPDTLREQIRGNLTGMDLSEAIAMDVALGNKLDALLLLVATGANDQCDWGKQLQQIVETAAELAIDGKVRS